MGKLKQFVDEKGNILSESIAEIVYLPVNGIKYGMIIRGKNVNNPLILYLHGGPGVPDYPFSENFRSLLEQNCSICWMEERGSGLSFYPNIPATSMTLEQIIDDTIEITNYLRKRFNQEKIYLMGNSWGSLIGIYIAAKYPEYFHAYIGISQVSNQFESEKIAYNYMIKSAKEHNDKKSIKKLQKYTLDSPKSITVNYFSNVKIQILNKYGIGITHTMKSVFKEKVVPIFSSKAYNFIQKINLIRGMNFSQKYFVEILIQKCPMDDIRSFKIPVYFIEGEFDYLVSSALAEKYFQLIEAPEKKLFKFTHSAHSPHFEEPEKFSEILFSEIIIRLQ